MTDYVIPSPDGATPPAQAQPQPPPPRLRPDPDWLADLKRDGAQLRREVFNLRGDTYSCATLDFRFEEMALRVDQIGRDLGRVNAPWRRVFVLAAVALLVALAAWYGVYAFGLNWPLPTIAYTRVHGG